MKSKGAVVATDRLGSVRASSTGDRMTYYPYGEERTSTADGREKFGTYMRDNVTKDYADQRYYAVGMGRFNSADPSTGDSSAEPATWNKYAYVVGDPINYIDPTGQWYGPAGPDPPPAPDPPLPGPQRPTPVPPAKTPKDTGTDGISRSKLNQRLKNFQGSNCDKVFAAVIGGYTTSDFTGAVKSTSSTTSTTRISPA